MGGTYFDTIGENFTDVPVTPDQKIETTQFLEAAESLVRLFDVFESSAFSVVQSDMNGNIKKIRTRQLQNPDQGKYLQDIVLGEVSEKKKDATQGLLWLTRGLDFTAVAMRKNIDNPEQELASSFTKSYNETLSQHHGMLVRPVFKLAMKACPYRKVFYEKLGSPLAVVEKQLAAWLAALEKLVVIIKTFLATGNYAKGL